jgi:hypothetical protein
LVVGMPMAAASVKRSGSTPMWSSGARQGDEYGLWRYGAPCARHAALRTIVRWAALPRRDTAGADIRRARQTKSKTSQERREEQDRVDRGAGMGAGAPLQERCD